MVRPDAAGEAAVDPALRWLSETDTKQVRVALASVTLPAKLRAHEGFVREVLGDPFTWTQEHRVAGGNRRNPTKLVSVLSAGRALIGTARGTLHQNTESGVDALVTDRLPNDRPKHRF